MSEKAFSPGEVRAHVKAGYDKAALIKRVNEALMSRPDQIDTGVWISVDVLDTDEETLRSILPGWDVRYQVDSRDGNAWVITAKK